MPDGPNCPCDLCRKNAGKSPQEAYESLGLENARLASAMRLILHLTDGYTEYGEPAAWGANQIARVALYIKEDR